AVALCYHTTVAAPIVLFCRFVLLCFFFFFNDTATPEIYTLSLHDALPISEGGGQVGVRGGLQVAGVGGQDLLRAGVDGGGDGLEDRKSTRLNSSHLVISYAVFCLKKKKKKNKTRGEIQQ